MNITVKYTVQGLESRNRPLLQRVFGLRLLYSRQLRVPKKSLSNAQRLPTTTVWSMPERSDTRSAGHPQGVTRTIYISYAMMLLLHHIALFYSTRRFTRHESNGQLFQRAPLARRTAVLRGACRDPLSPRLCSHIFDTGYTFRPPARLGNLI